MISVRSLSLYRQKCRYKERQKSPNILIVLNPNDKIIRINKFVNLNRMSGKNKTYNDI